MCRWENSLQLMSESGWGEGQVMEGHMFCIKESRLFGFRQQKVIKRFEVGSDI